MAFINMKLSPKEAKEEMDCCAPSGEEGPAYPYGLSLSLSNEVLTKLGMTSPPSVGSKLLLAAMVEVTSNSQYENQEGKEANVSLQITDMELTATGKSAAQRLYGKD
jgi:hypothetical protein